MPDGMQVAFLDAGGGMLEVFAPPGGATRAKDVPDGTAGVKHITFHFENIEEIFARLEEAGVEIKERPRFAVHSEMLHRIAFVRDPDGIVVELAEGSLTVLSFGRYAFYINKTGGSLPAPSTFYRRSPEAFFFASSSASSYHMALRTANEAASGNPSIHAKYHIVSSP